MSQNYLHKMHKNVGSGLSSENNARNDGKYSQTDHFRMLECANVWVNQSKSEQIY